jgi:oligopeptide transport system permease protein
MSDNVKKSGLPLSRKELFERAEYNREQAERITYSNYSYWRSTLRTFMKNKMGVFFLSILVGLLLFAFIQPLLPGQQSVTNTEYLHDIKMWRAGPSAKHWFGTDPTGRDMWARVWEATRTSLSLAILVAVTEIAIGIVVGTLWGYIKALDRPMTELYNVLTNIPYMVLCVLIGYVMEQGFWTIFFVLVFTGWVGMARYIRNMVLIIRDREYNLASRSLGTPVLRMIARNIIPFLISVIIMRLAVSIPTSIAAEVTLSYLGVGVPATQPSLGTMVSAAAPSFMAYPHLLFFPCLSIALFAMSFYVAGNAFSDASDPRNHM